MKPVCRYCGGTIVDEKGMISEPVAATRGIIHFHGERCLHFYERRQYLYKIQEMQEKSSRLGVIE